MTKPQRIAYCRACAQSAFEAWRGWPHRDAVPLLPRLDAETCAICANAEAVYGDVIAWVNYHGPYNTGLPDYWYLAIDGDPSHWGLPYYAEGVCPKCRTRTVISEMKYPSGTRELMHNCERCGVRDAS